MSRPSTRCEYGVNLSADINIEHNRIWNEQYETMAEDELRQLQLERLQSTLHRVSKNVRFYKNLFKEKGISPADISDLSDISKLPFTVKADLRDNYPYGMFAVPLREVVRIHSSSGTTGKPTVVGYTRRDLELWSELVARFLTAGGGDRRRCGPGSVRIWAFYRRLRAALRRGKNRRVCYSDFFRQHKKTNYDNAGL